jgi:hypothetical protein
MLWHLRGSILLLLLQSLPTVQATGPRKTLPRSHIVARLGLNYAVPTGDRTVPDIAVYGRQGDSTLLGFRTVGALGARIGLEWWYRPSRHGNLAIMLGLEWYLRPGDLKGEYADEEMRITRRAVRNRDIDIPIGLAWRADRLRVEAGVRVLWSYSQSVVAYDGQTKVETISTAKNMYPPKDRGYYPFVGVLYDLRIGEKVILSPCLGVERRGWKNEWTNWWDVEVGVALRLAK